MQPFGKRCLLPSVQIYFSAVGVFVNCAMILVQLWAPFYIV